MNFHTPIVLLVFNRPDLTRCVLERIREIQPKQLHVVADGPRHEADQVLVQQTQEVVKSLVDWDCELIWDASDRNLGCRQRVSTGITGAFRRFDEAIILEDDCLPTRAFFRFAAGALEAYREYPEVMHVGGFNLLGKTRPDTKLTCARIYPIWGWATWARAWKHYSVKIAEFEEKLSRRPFQDLGYFEPRLEQFYRSFYERDVDTWDYQWSFACHIAGGLGILPRNNLIENIGFGSEATHTHRAPPFKLPQTCEHQLTFDYPKSPKRDIRYEFTTYECFFNARPPSKASRILSVFKKRLRKLRIIGTTVYSIT